MIEKYIDVKNRIIVITGGSGQLGKTYTRALLDCGAKVINIDLHNCDEFNHDNYTQYTLDITSKENVNAILERIISEVGIPQVLINNAALDTPPKGFGSDIKGRFEDFSEDDWKKTFDLNVNAVFYLCQAFGELMKENSGGSIINISSIYGIVSPDHSIYAKQNHKPSFYKPVAYSASKSALINFSKYLAVYWAKDQITVNTLVFSGVFNNQNKVFLKNYNQRIPIGRMAEPEEYVPIILLLSSRNNTYMTGSTIVVDGGWTSI